MSATDAHVAAPAPLRLLTNWLVHALPPYAPSSPLAPVRTRDERTLEFTILVELAYVLVIAVVDAYGNCDAAVVEVEKNAPTV